LPKSRSEGLEIARFGAPKNPLHLLVARLRIVFMSKEVEAPSSSTDVAAPAIAEVSDDGSKRPKVLLCMVTIKFHGELEAKFVKCWKYVNDLFLIIPLRNYKELDCTGAGEAMIRVPRGWLVECAHPDFDLRCGEVIDLDDVEGLPWFVRQG
jgi:hypothetical protein